MKFLTKINEQRALLAEVDAGPEADATTPDPTATPSAEVSVSPVAPEGYVSLVKLLVKALGMNVPAGALDEIFRTEVTAENAFTLQTAVEGTIKQIEMQADNPERLDNINLKQFINSVNTGNFINRYKHVLTSMKKYNPYIKDEI